jgi:hypothetical protein
MAPGVRLPRRPSPICGVRDRVPLPRATPTRAPAAESSWGRSASGSSRPAGGSPQDWRRIHGGGGVCGGRGAEEQDLPPGGAVPAGSSPLHHAPDPLSRPRRSSPSSTRRRRSLSSTRQRRRPSSTRHLSTRPGFDSSPCPTRIAQGRCCIFVGGEASNGTWSLGRPHQDAWWTLAEHTQSLWIWRAPGGNAFFPGSCRTPLRHILREKSPGSGWCSRMQ